MTLIPTQVTFRHLAHSDALEAHIRERAAELEQFYPGIVGCHVAVEVPNRHREKGRQYHVSLEVTVPGHAPIVVSHSPSLHSPLKDVGEEAHHKDSEVDSVHRHAYVAIRQAFDVARRQLQDIAREQRGAVKAHEVPAHGEIVEIQRVDGFGFIQSGEARVYFNRASVLDDAFDRLEAGTRVAFIEEKGEKGPQASSVRVLGKHRYIAP